MHCWQLLEMVCSSNTVRNKTHCCISKATQNISVLFWLLRVREQQKGNVVSFTWQQCLRERPTIWHRTLYYVLPVLLNLTISSAFLQAFKFFFFFFVSRCFYSSSTDRPVHHLSLRPIHHLSLSSPLPNKNLSRLLDPLHNCRPSQDNKESHSNAFFIGLSYLLQR